MSRGASYGYLDSIFIDMMWYKAFSVYLLVRLGYNVLFQDVDLVWFRDPFPYFKEHLAQHSHSHSRPGSGAAPGANPQSLNSSSPSSSSSSHSGASQLPDAFFSDDGQRTLRYTPFYANSGFYYLLANRRTEHFAWSVVTAFDILQATGSHQNVFTLRLLEGLDLTQIHPKLLPLTKFATGVMFHHNKTFMEGIAAGTETPYNFHMCWTANKGDKLTNFKVTLILARVRPWPWPTWGSEQTAMAVEFLVSHTTTNPLLTSSVFLCPHFAENRHVVLSGGGTCEGDATSTRGCVQVGDGAGEDAARRWRWGGGGQSVAHATAPHLPGYAQRTLPPPAVTGLCLDILVLAVTSSFPFQIHDRLKGDEPPSTL